MNKEKTEKYKNIEFLRIFMIIAIIFYHISRRTRAWNLLYLYPNINVFKDLKEIFNSGFMGVEGFFILGGFFLHHIYSKSSNISVKTFITRKYLRLAPLVFLVIAIFFFAHLFGIVDFSYIESVFSVLLLNQFFAPYFSVNWRHLWFVSSLFISMILYFHIIKNCSKTKGLIYFTFIVIASYIILFLFLPQFKFNTNGLEAYKSIINLGLLRGLGGIGLGCIFSVMWNKYRDIIAKFNANRIQSFFINLIEIFSLSYIVFCLYCPHPAIHPLFFIGNFILLLFLFLSKKGFLSKFFEKDFWTVCGKYSYSLYIIHYIIIQIMDLGFFKQQPVFCRTHPVYAVTLLFGTICIVAILAYHLVDVPIAALYKKSQQGKKQTG